MLEDTTLPDTGPEAGSGDPEQGARDYETVRRTLRAITERWREQPSLDDLAREAGVQPIQLQRVFSRWAGITPKQFLQAITLDMPVTFCDAPRRCWMRHMKSACRDRRVCMISSSPMRR